VKQCAVVRNDNYVSGCYYYYYYYYYNYYYYVDDTIITTAAATTNDDDDDVRSGARAAIKLETLFHFMPHRWLQCWNLELRNTPCAVLALVDPFSRHGFDSGGGSSSRGGK
jgi:hypothetical protein